MTKEQASKVRKVVVVVFCGTRCIVESVKTSGMAAPYFRLSDAHDGRAVAHGDLVSHQVVSWPRNCVEIVNR